MNLGALDLTFLTAAVAIVIAFLVFVLKKAAETIIKEEYKAWAPPLARLLTRLAGWICPSRRAHFQADLQYTQQVAKEPGLVEALSCLLGSPRLLVVDAFRSLVGLLVAGVRLGRRGLSRTAHATRRIITGSVRIPRDWSALRSEYEIRIKAFAESFVDRCIRRSNSLAWLLMLSPTIATLVAGSLLIADELLLASVAFTFACSIEFFDGIAAKRRPHPRRAVLLDYTADRLCDIVIFGALAWWALPRTTIVAVAALVTAVAALLSSYVRAETTAMGFAEHDVHAGRSERLIFLVAALWFGAVGGARDLMTALVALDLVVTIVSLGERVHHATTAPLRIDDAVTAAWTDDFLPKPAVNEPTQSTIDQEEKLPES